MFYRRLHCPEGTGVDLLKSDKIRKAYLGCKGICIGFPKEEGNDRDRKNNKSPFSKLHHLSIVVRNMDEAIKFYESLGIGPSKTIPFKRIREPQRSGRNWIL